MSLTPTTELMAVNTMLATIGEAPVNSITDSPSADVAVALSTLREVSREVQSEGWHFNTEHEYPLVPDVNGNIIVPSSIIYVDVDYPRQSTLDVVLRGTQLYNRTDHTYTFTETVLATVRHLLDFDLLPEAARRYIALRASRMFQDRVVGSGTLHDFNTRDEGIARAHLVQMEADQADNSPLMTEDILYGMQR